MLWHSFRMLLLDCTYDFYWPNFGLLWTLIKLTYLICFSGSNTCAFFLVSFSMRFIRHSLSCIITYCKSEFHWPNFVITWHYYIFHFISFSNIELLTCGNSRIFLEYFTLICEDFPGPIKLPTRSVCDLKLVLSVNCLTMVCFCFRITNSSVTSSLICYGYIGQMGAIACSFVTRC
jgi:hypothetical protein